MSIVFEMLYVVVQAFFDLLGAIFGELGWRRSLKVLLVTILAGATYWLVR